MDNRNLRDLLTFEPREFDVNEEKEVILEFSLNPYTNLHNVLHALTKYKSLPDVYSNPQFCAVFSVPDKTIVTNDYNIFREKVLKLGEHIRAGELESIGIGDWQEDYYSVLILISQDKSYIQLSDISEESLGYLTPFVDATLDEDIIRL